MLIPSAMDKIRHFTNLYGLLLNLQAILCTYLHALVGKRPRAVQ